ncbi:MAG: VWA domain-containing protein [Pseudomonadota bacterium]
MGRMSNAKTPATKGNSKAALADKGEVDAFLAALNRTPSAAGSGRLLFALDATMSRQRTWDSACHIQADMFREASSVNGLAMKLIYFRGFDECRASAWKTDGKALAKSMAGIECLGGHTQISRVLAFARKQIAEAPVPALVYIGDAVEENPDRLSHQAGELGLLGCKLFMFHEGRDPIAGRTFKSMAKASGGGYFQLDARSAETLASLLKAVARYASGGRTALESANSGAGRLLLEQMQ